MAESLMQAILKIRPELDVAAMQAQVKEAATNAADEFSAEFSKTASAEITDSTATAFDGSVASAGEAGAKAGDAYAAGVAPGVAKAGEETVAATKKSSEMAAAKSEGALASVGKAHSAMTSLVGMGSAFVAFKGVEAAMSAEASAQTAEIVFGKAAESVKKFAEGAANTMGLANDLALQQTNHVGNIVHQVMGVSQEQAATMSENLIKRSNDIAYAAGGSLAEIQSRQADLVTAMSAAVAGKPARALAQYGVIINNTTLQQEALRLGLVKYSGDQTKANLLQAEHAMLQEDLTKAIVKYGANSSEVAVIQARITKNEADYAKAVQGKVPALTQAQKAQAAYNLVLDQTNQYNDFFNKNQNGSAEQLAKTKAAFANFEENLGGTLLPVLKDVMGPLQSMMKLFTDSPKWLQSTIVYTTLGTLALTKMGTAVKALKDGYTSMKTIITDIGNAFDWAKNKITGNTVAQDADTASSKNNAAAKEAQTSTSVAAADAAAVDAGAQTADAAAEEAATGAAVGEGTALAGLTAEQVTNAGAAQADATAQAELAASEAGGGMGGLAGIMSSPVARVGSGLLGAGLLASGVMDQAHNHVGGGSVLKDALGGAALGFGIGGPEGALVGLAGGLAYGGTSWLMQKFGMNQMATGGTVYPTGRIVQLAEGGEPEDVVPHSKRAGYVSALAPTVGGMVGSNTFNITVHNAQNLDAQSLARELDRLSRDAASKYTRTTRVPA